MQAEHIPGAPGRHAQRRGGGARLRPRARRRLDPQRPLRGRHPPARHHGDLTRVRCGSELLGFAASRAHHADVGAAEPGSMPADSRTIHDEGVVIEPSRLAAGGELDRELLDSLVSRMRNPRQREADLRAQLAANRTGAERMQALAEGMGSAELRAGNGRDPGLRRAPHARRHRGAGRRRAHRLGRPGGRRPGPRSLRVRATVRGEEIQLDFAGSAGAHEGNLNCPLAVTLSACYFALRVLADPDVPPCAGAYRPLTVYGTRGLAAARPSRRPRWPLETWRPHRAWPTWCWARSAVLSGQGTMNNLTLGNERLHLLRDARRRPGRVRGRARAQARSMWP